MGPRTLSMVLLSAVLHAGWNVVAKRHPRPTAFLFLLTAVTAVPALVLAPFYPAHLFTGELGEMLVASCLFHGFSFVVLARAYEVGDLSLVYPIARSTPAIVPLLAVPLLGEHISPIGAVGIALSLIGMWLVQTGGVLRWTALRAPAALWAYLMLLLTASFSLVDKRGMDLLTHAPWSSPLPRAMAFYLLQTAGAALVAAPYTLAREGLPRLRASLREHAPLIVTAACAMFASYAIVLECLRTAQISYIVAVRQSSVLFAVAFAVWKLAERPNWMRMTGTLGTLVGIVLIALYA